MSRGKAYVGLTAGVADNFVDYVGGKAALRGLDGALCQTTNEIAFSLWPESAEESKGPPVQSNVDTLSTEKSANLGLDAVA